jgi:hypothetical protein
MKTVKDWTVTGPRGQRIRLHFRDGATLAHLQLLHPGCRIEPEPSPAARRSSGTIIGGSKAGADDAAAT